MSDSNCEAIGWTCNYQNWRPFDFNFEPKYLWSNLVFYVLNLASLLALFILSHKIKSTDFIKSYVITVMYAPACLITFAIFFDLNRLLDAIYISHYLSEAVLKIFNGIAKTTFLISSGVVLILAMWTAHFRKPLSRAWCWTPFCLVIVFAISWLFFFANRLHYYFWWADMILIGMAAFVFLCCSSFRFGLEVNPVIGEARSRLIWLCVFIFCWLCYYGWFEIFYFYASSNSYYHVLRGFEFVAFGLGVLVLLPPYRLQVFRCQEQPNASGATQNDSGYMRTPEPMPPPSAPAPEYSPSTVSTSSIYPMLPSQHPSYYLPPQYPMMMHPASTTIIRYSSSPMLHHGMIIQQNRSYPQMQHQASTGNFYFVSQ